MVDKTKQEYVGRWGVTTRPDVDALLKKYPPRTLKAGMHISDDDITDVIKLRRTGKDKNRFETVVNAWRRRLLDHHVNLHRVWGANKLKVLSNNETYDRVADTAKRVRRMAVRRHRECDVTRPVNQKERERKVLVTTAALAIAGAANASHKNLIDLTTVSRPMPRLVQKK